jgi:aryl-alcohol dehydrogenase-like predicted oxidoreductase
METRKIGSLKVSTIGLGGNNFGQRIDQVQTDAVVAAALDAGITYFDTAEGYGEGQSEILLGRALGARHSEAVIATKFGHTNNLKPGERGGDPAQIRARLERSLSRLGTDRIDHYQLHRPDTQTPIAETLGCLAELKAEGKIREIGCTHFTAAQLREAHAVAAMAGWPSIQNHYSMLTRDPERDGVLDACRELGVAFVPYFPLESGLLTGKYKSVTELPQDSRLAMVGSERAAQFLDGDKLACVRKLEGWARDHGRGMLDLAMSWLTSNPLVATVIAGATKPEQVRANAVAGGWALTEAERAEVAAILG